jgi:hypothetical protein
MEEQTQNHIHAALRHATTHNSTERLRAAFKKWNIVGFPRIHTDRCQRNLKLIMSHLAPRIGFKCWHTIFRRWATAKKNREKGQTCLLGCTEHEDSVEHYAKCRIPREWAATRLQLHYDHKNSLHMWTLTAHFPNEVELFKTAFMVYATYRATNHFRHNGTNTDPMKQKEETKEHLNQTIHIANLGERKYKLFEEHGSAKKKKSQTSKKTCNKEST